jgi:hypothetical protein
MASQPADRAGASTVDLQPHGASPLGRRYLCRLDIASGNLQRLAATPAARSRCSGLVGRYRGGEVVDVYVAGRPRVPTAWAAS